MKQILKIDCAPCRAKPENKTMTNRRRFLAISAAAITFRGLLVLVQLVMAAIMTAPSGISLGRSGIGPAIPS